MVRRVSAIGGDDKILQPMTNLITTYRTLNSASATMFPPFPESTLHKLVAMTSTLPNLDVKSVLRRYFPVHLHTDASLSERSESVAKKFLQENEKNISEFSLESSPKQNSISVNFENGVKSSVPVRSLRVFEREAREFQSFHTIISLTSTYIIRTSLEQQRSNVHSNITNTRTQVHFPHALSDVVRAVPTKSFSEALHAITLDHCFGRHVLVYVLCERGVREFKLLFVSVVTRISLVISHS